MAVQSGSIYLSKFLTLVSHIMVCLLLESHCHAQAGNLQDFVVERLKAAQSESKLSDKSEKIIILKEEKAFEVFKANTPQFNRMKKNRNLLKSGGGGLDGGGGATRAQEFAKIASDLVDRIEKEPTLHGKFDLAAFRDFVTTTEVAFVPWSLFLNGVPKDAINYPSLRKIEINISAWDEMKNVNRKAGLILHEFYGLLRIDDTGYLRSIKILSPIKIVLAQDYSDIAAERGSPLDSYDVIAANLRSLWSQKDRDWKSIEELSTSILKFFFGFYNVKLDGSEVSIETLYYLATNLRHLLPYNVPNEGFARLSDTVIWSTRVNSTNINIPISSQELVIDKNVTLGFKQKYDESKGRISGCQITIPANFVQRFLAKENLLRPIFLVSANCNGDFTHIDTTMYGR